MAKNAEPSSCWFSERLLTFLRLLSIRHTAPKLTLLQLRWKSSSEPDVSSTQFSGPEKKWKKHLCVQREKQKPVRDLFSPIGERERWNHYIRQISLVSKPKCKHENYRTFKNYFNLLEGKYEKQVRRGALKSEKLKKLDQSWRFLSKNPGNWQKYGTESPPSKEIVV